MSLDEEDGSSDNKLYKLLAGVLPSLLREPFIVLLSLFKGSDVAEGGVLKELDGEI